MRGPVDIRIVRTNSIEHEKYTLAVLLRGGAYASSTHKLAIPLTPLAAADEAGDASVPTQENSERDTKKARRSITPERQLRDERIRQLTHLFTHAACPGPHPFRFPPLQVPSTRLHTSIVSKHSRVFRDIGTRNGSTIGIPSSQQGSQLASSEPGLLASQLLTTPHEHRNSYDDHGPSKTSVLSKPGPPPKLQDAIGR
ncbi:hypothetical protein Hypma_010769 [Hypsizygus marmoreus]|uniref:Uncharacterized protein n=1 Tax=Hypsizygus marmoreus TaxID=39966 RepID=A0A369JLT3_HYPMA|nr:hypothetical protein Hypma_010769 [Hypsizygus marmoreus]